MKITGKVAIIILVIIVIGIIIARFVIPSYLGSDKENKDVKNLLSIESEAVEVTNYYVYGTHYNVEGKLSGVEITNISDIKFVLLNDSGNEKEYNAIYEIINNEISLKISNLINDGIYLEDIETGKYSLLLKVKYLNDDIKYYSMNNNSDYNDIEYYTITKKGTNKRINIGFDILKTENGEVPYNKFNIENAKLPDEVYDISIDPGHGGSDPGAVSGQYKEAEIAMKYCAELKRELENLGLKVILTRDGTEDKSETSKFNVYSVYNSDGRVNIVGKSKAKYNFSVHLNSSEVNTDNGTEIYAPVNASLNFAQLLADNIVNIANTKYSNRDKNKVSKGVYVRTFTDAEIRDSERGSNRKGFIPYDIKTSTNYLYMIREVGGMMTGAYVDGRNPEYGSNMYYNSNIGVESYLVELGYIINKTDLDNMLNNQSAYIEAITKSIQEYICKE